MTKKKRIGQSRNRLDYLEIWEYPSAVLLVGVGGNFDEDVWISSVGPDPEPGAGGGGGHFAQAADEQHQHKARPRIFSLAGHVL